MILILRSKLTVSLSFLSEQNFLIKKMYFCVCVYTHEQQAAYNTESRLEK